MVALRRFLLTLFCSIVFGGSAGMLLTMLFMAFFMQGADSSIHPGILIFAPIMIPFGVAITLPITVIPTVIYGLVLTPLERLAWLRAPWRRTLLGGGAGAYTGHLILAQNLETWGSTMPGLFMGGTIIASWPLFGSWRYINRPAP